MQTQNTTIKHSTTAAILEESPTQGLFELTFTNSRRHGMRPMQTHHCQGVLYNSGHVHLDTRNIVVTDFGTLSQMCEYLENFGYFSVSWFVVAPPVLSPACTIRTRQDIIH